MFRVKVSRVVQCLGLAVAGLFLFIPLNRVQAGSPVGFSVGDYAGDFVKEKGNGRIWYINVHDSRRYQITEDDPALFGRLLQTAQPQAWPVIEAVPQNGVVTVQYRKQPGLKGLVFDEIASDVLWHIQRRAYRRQALRSREDILAYAQNAMPVNDKDLYEYPIAYANYDHSIIDPVKKPDLSASSTRPDLAKFVRISLREQRIWTYEKGRLVNTFLVSTGRGKYSTPRGEFSVLEKRPVVNYVWSYGEDNPDNYDLGNVPYNLRIMPHKYIHYAYWHHNFGHTMSHGCVNVGLKDAKWIYRWADKGVSVLIQ